uniref:Uncharacterized protein n=1 Tax=Oryza barthii TaxID=65489 RepID=A0A0D3HVH9_9ORYZ
MRVIIVRHQKSLFSAETKPPRRTTVVQVNIKKARPLTAIDKYPMSTAYLLMLTTSGHNSSMGCRCRWPC